MNKFITIDQLNTQQLAQYRIAVSEAFPPIIGESQVIKDYWCRLESYFCKFQLYLIANDGDLIGFMNAIPFRFEMALDQLPEEGWDWMFRKGVSGFEDRLSPNYLGGLQVIVRKQYQQLGYSRLILTHAKSVFKSYKLLNLVIPIRPTKKHVYPELSMQEYLELRDQKQIFDPWIRTHVKSGAEIIKVCERSMTMKGDVKFWETILDTKIVESGSYLLAGALTPISIDIDSNIGSYIEPNIWIKYG